jgi:hypothetical protein
MSPFDAAKWIIGLALAALLFFGGRACGESKTNEDIYEMQTLLATKNRTFRHYADTFRAFAQTFRAISAITEANQAEAKRRRDRAQDTVRIEADARRAAQAAANDLQRKLDEAKRTKPGCKALLETDMEAACGLQLR